MTLFFNLHRLGWRRTPLLRVRIPLPSWRQALLFVLLLLLGTQALDRRAALLLRDAMADELVAARVLARDWEQDAIALMNNGRVMMFGEDGQWHVISTRNNQHLEVKP